MASQQDEAEEGPTLYAASPYFAADTMRRERRAEAAARRRAYGQRHPLFFGTARRIADPSLLTVLVLLLGLAYVFLPFGSLFGRYGDAARGGFFPSTIISIGAPNMPAQKTFTLGARTKGCHLVQSEVDAEVRDIMRGVKAGILTLFILHTSAALSLNENFDRDVRSDMDMALDHAVPEDLPWRHTDEGPDDSASHTKASLIGPSLTIPITDGRMNLGTWQGVVRAVVYLRSTCVNSDVQSMRDVL
ncbi:Rho GTPase activating protein [Malassezia vespertilionis]|uniref:Rho GTPase activating protein n=1 Tax=Malassezia vespertilionis TaxID=2020962 RepID=UPI0024B15E1C|nr:Rho GTPase activating protein [Malassezia vespertilionis]WFD06359.1 Rho GTPase activating protein [Malassezia vespertilionis]